MEVLLHRKPAYTKDIGFVSPAVELPSCIEELGNFDLKLSEVVLNTQSTLVFKYEKFCSYIVFDVLQFMWIFNMDFVFRCPPHIIIAVLQIWQSRGPHSAGF
jgi:hypothetical protein